jgi:hypothetical protein
MDKEKGKREEREGRKVMMMMKPSRERDSSLSLPAH